MIKNTFIFLILFAVLGVAGWIFMQKNKSVSEKRADDLLASASPSFSTSPESTPPIITIEGGLKVQDLRIGTGTEAAAGDLASVNYVGMLADGTKFDSSYDRGQAFLFPIGAGKVIRGWDIGVAGMKIGGKRRLIIPPNLAYGAPGIPGVIPPNATLIFEVELLDLKSGGGKVSQ